MKLFGLLSDWGLIFLALTLVFVLFVAIPSSFAQQNSDKLSKVIDQLISAFNNQKADSYRKNFSEKMQNKFSIEDIDEFLKTRMKNQGEILSHKINMSPDRKRALVFLEMKNAKFDVHFRINEKNEIERLIWFPHKPDPTTLNFSGHEIHEIQNKYQPIVDKFVRAIRDTNAEAILSLIVKDEDDDWTLEDYKSFLIRLNKKGIQRVGEVEVLGQSEILFPIYFGDADRGFYLDFNKANKISNLKITNYATSESKRLSYASLGNDTLLTSDLKNYDQLRDDFASDSGKVRFIALLSPT